MSVYILGTSCAETNAQAWFSIALRPRKPEGSLGRTAQDGHLGFHTAPELWWPFQKEEARYWNLRGRFIKTPPPSHTHTHTHPSTPTPGTAPTSTPLSSPYTAVRSPPVLLHQTHLTDNSKRLAPFKSFARPSTLHRPDTS